MRINEALKIHNIKRAEEILKHPEIADMVQKRTTSRVHSKNILLEKINKKSTRLQ